jgi:hypothetical protein
LVSMESNKFGREGISGNHQVMSASDFRQTRMVSGKMPLSPSRESFSPSGRAANPASFRNAPSNSQRFFTRTSPGNGGTIARPANSLGNPNNTARVQPGFGAGRNSGAFNRPSSQSPSQPMNTQRTNNSPTVQSNRPGWRTFTPPQSAGSNRPSQGFGENGRSTPNNSPRSTFTPPSRPSTQTPASTFERGQTGNNNSWQHFTPRAQQPQRQELNRGFSQPTQSQPRQFQPPSSSRSGSSNSYNNSRPPLNMRQPVVTPRGGSGGYYNAPRGSYNQPRGGSGYSAPRPSYNAPRGGGGGYSAPRPSYSAPRGGGYSGGGNSRGGSSGGGGGSHNGGGGGHSSNNRSR